MDATQQVGSNYPNPLDEFRTYSYHFILTAASTTEAFRQMMGNSAAGKSPLISAVNDVQIGEEININGETAFLVVDTRRFSQYSITELEMDHMYGTGTRSNPTVPTAMTRMKLIDTTGLSFFNMMMDLMRNKLKSSRASIFFLLAIVFVGHRDDGSTETISTCYIPLNLLTMGFEFTSSGSVYEINFFETEGGPGGGGVAQQINHLGGVTTISTKNGNTLGEMLGALEQRLNIQSLEFFQKYSNEALAASSDVQKNEAKFGKLVQYMITIPDEWAQYKLSTAARSKNIEQQFLASKAANKADMIKAEKQKANVVVSNVNSQITFSQTASITDAIKVILESSEDLLKEASTERRRAGTARGYKTAVGITSDDTTYTVHFDIYPYSIPKTSEDKKKDGEEKVKPGTSSTEVLDSFSKNVITYDYIFTGKNSHIIDLRIKYSPASQIAFDSDMELGRKRFATNAEAGQKTTDVKEVAKGSAKTSDFSPQYRPGDPIFPPVKTKAQQDNNAGQKTEAEDAKTAAGLFKAKQEYTQTMAMLHFLGTTSMDMSIRGNPNLLRKYADRETRGGIAPHQQIISAQELNALVSSGQQTAENNFLSGIEKGLNSSKAQYIKEYVQPRLDAMTSSTSNSPDELLNNIDVLTQPVLVKVNIMAPNVDSTGTFLENENMFTDSFFFKGSYMLLNLKTTFIGGEFVHSMNLSPADLGGEYSSSGDTPNAAPKQSS